MCGERTAGCKRAAAVRQRALASLCLLEEAAAKHMQSRGEVVWAEKESKIQLQF